MAALYKREGLPGAGIVQLNMARVVHALMVLALAGACWAQFDDSPVPSRLQILGAVPVPAGPPRGRPVPIARVRRPGARAQQAYLPTPPARLEVTQPPPPPPPPTIPPTLPPRPVAEEVEEYDDLDQPTPLPQLPSSPPPNFPPPSVRQQLRSGPDRPIQIQVASPIPISISEIPVQTPTRQQFRQQQNPRPAFRPELRPLLRPAPAPLEEVAPIRQQVRRPQPIPVEDVPHVTARQQFRQQARPVPVEQPHQRQQQQQPERQQQQELFNVRPQQKQAQPYSPYKNQRERKPVAQVLNKYRNDNPDGSITWGYENDDGSFKEETIGVDCVVSGKYGYVDPDGQRREYSYSSGIPCDKTKEKEEAAEDQGYIDYTNNAYVLPNGQSIPIQGSSKNKGRRPAPGGAPANYGK